MSTTRARFQIIVLAGVLLAAPPALANTVGAAGAVNTKSTSVQPGKGERVIEIGAQIVRNEKISTSGSGSVQVLFIDRTSLNIGPNSSIVIDEFVYDPAAKTGAMSVRLGKGVLRVVGGQVTHTGGATVTTPAASVGIRGGIATIRHCAGACGDSPGTRAILHFGKMTVSGVGPGGTLGEPQLITRPGFGTIVAGVGAQPPAPARVPQNEVNDVNTALTSKPGQHGGAPRIPSDTMASQSGIGSGPTPDPGTLASRQAQNTSGQSNGATQPTVAALSAQVQSAQQSAQQGQQASTSQSTSERSDVVRRVVQQPTPTHPTTPTGPTYPTGPLSTTAFVLTTRADATGLGQSTYPFLTASFVASGTTSIVTPIYGYREGSAAGATPNKARVMQANLIMTGQGAAQSSKISLMTAMLGPDTTYGETFAGGFAATGRPCATCYQTRASGYVSSAPSSIQVNSDGLPTGSFATNQNGFNFLTGAYSNQTAQTNAGGAGNVNYNFNQTVTASASTPAGLGAKHPDAQLALWAGGVAQTIRFTGAVGQAASNPYLVVGVGSVSLVGGASRMGAQISAFGYTPSAVARTYIGEDSGLRTYLNSWWATASAPTSMPLDLRMGAASKTDPATGWAYNGARAAYIDYDTFGARAETIMNPVTGEQVNTSAMYGRPLTGAAPTGGYADSVTSLMATSDAVGANTAGFLSSLSTAPVVPCACDYTKWGFWSFDAYQNDAATGAGYATRGHLNTWVAGIPANAVDMPVTGTATYVGHAIATVTGAALPNSSGSPATYLASGTFTNTWNFATARGLVNISNLDSTNYTGMVALGRTAGSTAPGVGFAGALAGSTGGRQMLLTGSFFQGGPTSISPKVGEMGGSLNIFSTTSTYMGSGTFAAKRVH
jgi:hypothetical protein